MTVYSAFAPSVLGMNSQAHSLATISQNIANVTTGGYKKTETRFQTMVSDTLGHGQDFGGVRPKDVQMISQQGLIYTTARDLDLAIVGDGFFVVSDKTTGGNTFYSRDGSFDSMQVGQVGRTALNTNDATTGKPLSGESYLVDKNGFFLMGWAPDATTGIFPTSGTPQAMRVDSDYFANLFEATTKSEISLNLPAGATQIANHATAVAAVDAGTAPAGYQSYSVGVVDSTGKLQSVRFNFTRSALNTWQISASTSGGTSAATTIAFNSAGGFTSITGGTTDAATKRTTYTFSNLSFTGTPATTATFKLDVTDFSQFDSGFIALTQNTNGFEKSALDRLTWDEQGYLVGGFTNDNSRRLYQVPLANFVSPDNLAMKNGMVFEQTEKSGFPQIEGAQASGRAGFSPATIEQSNVDIAEEFTRMIMTQAAYNANSVAFRTNDELTMTARDLAKA